MIIDAHSHPYDPQVFKTRWDQATKFVGYGVDRRVLDGRTRAEYYGQGLTVERMLAEMEEAGVEKTVVLNGRHNRVQGGEVVRNETVYELYLKPHPNRFIGFAGCDPIAQDGSFNQAGLDEFKHAVNDLGFVGMKLLPTYCHYAPTDPRVYPYYALAVEMGLPVVMHQAMAPTRDSPSEYARPHLLDRVLWDFPTLRLDAAHLGAPWEDELFGLMIKHPNLYTDISYVCELGPERVARGLAAVRAVGGLSRVMLGTDSCCRPLKCYVDWVRTGLNETLQRMGYKPFTPEEIDGLLGGNAARFLRLEVPAGR